MLGTKQMTQGSLVMYKSFSQEKTMLVFFSGCLSDDVPLKDFKMVLVILSEGVDLLVLAL